MQTQLIERTPTQIVESAMSVLDSSEQILNKSYLSQLEQSALRLISKENAIDVAGDVRIFRIERVVLENKQSMLESMAAAYTALGTAGYSVFLLVNGDGYETTLYLGVRGEPQKSSGQRAGDLLQETFRGHFSGSQLEQMKGEDQNRLLEKLRAKNQTITSVTGVPSLSLEEREHFMQGLEHFIDAAENHRYQALILAEPVSSQALKQIKAGYEQVATQLSPLLKQQLSFGENESDSVGLSISESISQSLGKSVGLTETIGSSESVSNTTTQGTNTSETVGSSYSKGTSTSSTYSSSTSAGIGIPFVAQLTQTIGISRTHSSSETHTTSQSKTTGSSYSEAVGKTQGTSQSQASSYTDTRTDTLGLTKGESFNKTLGTNRQVSIEMVNKQIEQLLKRVDHQLERVDEARRYGGWNTAAYFIADNRAVTTSLASIFLGLMRGANSNSEDFALTTWENELSVANWLSNLTHPRLFNPAKNIDIPYLTPATLVSGKEMAIQLSLPRRSTSTVSVVEAQSFGRRVQDVSGKNIQKSDRSLTLGKIRHLWQDLPQEVKLSLDDLTGHTFVTGSTGSGKSNTVYHLLDQARKDNVAFMVIEPAKGEYKHIFGHYDNVTVLGTNPHHSQLLKINPFKFPKGIHILEHIDRLIEIFNVCWPMYAAMPAVLKAAMLTAYQQAGWDLDNSTNQYNENIFPTFDDLFIALEEVIENSAFSGEVKSNYIGSLVTRVKSLTNGLNGQIFSAQEIDNEQLFNQNVIIDLSRVGSQETKSLIMGLLIMKLSEFRMVSEQMNQPLKHITVLEEAHNILKRTSTEQSSEGANVAGKSVEMLSNAIAEMRTYGEGFVIADQSPNAVDISAIRNTNTKIIMRLPEESDRVLAGKAAGVSDEQICEIAKLPKGVAVVYQNNWLEPVLCHIYQFKGEEKVYQYEPHFIEKNTREIKQKLIKLLAKEDHIFVKQIDLDKLLSDLNEFVLPTKTKLLLIDLISSLKNGSEPLIWENSNNKELAKAITYLIGEKKVYECMKKFESSDRNNIGDLIMQLRLLIKSEIGLLDNHYNSLIENGLIFNYQQELYSIVIDYKKENLL